MIETIGGIIASVTFSCLFCLGTVKMLGAMQQGGYKNKNFSRWFDAKNNWCFNRLLIFSVCITLTTAIVALCFSFLGAKWASLISAIPFLLFSVLYIYSDKKYALKVPVNKTGRFYRLFSVYLLITACCSYAFIAVLGFLAKVNGSELYRVVAYVPYGVFPMLLPLFLCIANFITGIFENARNKKFVKRAGQVLDETKILRVGIVGSYGKTSVKNILCVLLSEKYSVVQTPESYNTPIGIAKTVFSEEFLKKEVFIAEMGARKEGDIAELCKLVKPDYAIFTGICEQHLATFGSLRQVWNEKSEILKCRAKKVVCGESLRERILSQKERISKIVFAESAQELCLAVTGTKFRLNCQGKTLEIDTKLLGRANAENISLAVALATEMGLTVEEIERGLQKLQPVPHRLQCIIGGGAYILDDGYNCNPRGAENALEVLSSHAGRKCIVTPGIVECGVLEEKINGELGEKIAKCAPDKVIFVGETLVGAVSAGYKKAGGDTEKCKTVPTLQKAQALLAEWVCEGDAILFLNDLPDVY